MRVGRVLIYVALIIIIGLAAVYFFLQRRSGEPSEAEAPPTPQVVLVNVVITTQPIRRGDIIIEDVLELREFPQDSLIPGMFVNVSSVLGRQAKYDLEAGTILMESNLVESTEELSESGSNAALRINPGMVAVSIPISRLTAVAYALRPGDRVNVIVTMLYVDMDTNFQTILPNNASGVIAPGVEEAFLSVTAEEATEAQFGPELNLLTSQIIAGGQLSPVGRTELDPTLDQPFYVIPSETQRPRMVSQTLLQDVVVLNVGNFELPEEAEQPLPAAAPTQEVLPGQEAPPEGEVIQPAQVILPPDIITLIVTPQDAVTLNYLLYSGAQISLALRSSGDDSRILTEAVTLQFLMEQYNIPLPARLPYGFEPNVSELEAPTLLNDIETPEPQR